MWETNMNIVYTYVHTQEQVAAQKRAIVRTFFFSGTCTLIEECLRMSGHLEDVMLKN
jgi:DNA invertase Pin-like site-specific DNA recombinase